MRRFRREGRATQRCGEHVVQFRSHVTRRRCQATPVGRSNPTASRFVYNVISNRRRRRRPRPVPIHICLRHHVIPRPHGHVTPSRSGHVTGYRATATAMSAVFGFDVVV